MFNRYGVQSKHISIPGTLDGGSGAVYYVDDIAGNDANDGLSPSQAWQTVNKVTSFNPAPGETVLFKRGGVWRELWSVNEGGDATDDVFYGAYDVGEPPKITGCDLLTGWTDAGLGGGLFSDGFESGDISAWDASVNPGGQLTVTNGAAMLGSEGLDISIAGQVHAYVQDNTPADETTYRCRFYIDPNGLTMANAEEFICLRALNGAVASVFFVKLQYYIASGYKLVLFTRDDSWAATTTSVDITDDSHYVELYWKAATAPGANNGVWESYVDGAQKQAVSNIDNDTLSIATLRMGAELELDAGTNGNLFMDAFYSHASSDEIGAADPVMPVYQADYTEAISIYLLIEDDSSATLVADLDAVNGAGKFWHDAANNLMYYWATDGADPDTHEMEVGARYDAVSCNDRAYITFSNLHFHGAGGQFGRGFGLKPTWMTPTNITLINCEASHSYYTNIWVAYAVGFDPIDVFLMLGCVVTDGQVFGIRIEGEDGAHRLINIRLENCSVYDNGTLALGEQGVFIKFCTAPIVTQCEIYDNVGYLDWSDNLLFGTCDALVVSYNVLHGGNHAGIHLDVRSWGEIIYNVCYGHAWNAIWIEEHQAGGGDSSNIYHNTCYDNRIGIVFGPGSTIREVSGVTVKNNIFTKNHYTNFELNEEGVGPDYLNNVVDYNVYFGQTDHDDYEGEFRAEPVRVNKTFAQWKTYTSWDANSLNVDPLLVDPDNTRFDLQDGSPAIDAGVDVGLDYLGPDPDCGRYEKE